LADEAQISKVRDSLLRVVVDFLLLEIFKSNEMPIEKLYSTSGRN